MRVIKSVSEMQAVSRQQTREKKVIGFVPTMGAIHEGHLSLIRKAVMGCDFVVVSVFLNPIQFNNKQDFEEYPRDPERDAGLISAEKADLLFLPEAAHIYPGGYKTFVEVKGVTEHLCGRSRAGHFAGVATIVSKLFNIVRPTIVYMGQKDYQQTRVVSKLIEDLNYHIELVVVATVREESGLALSSRNLLLGRENREKAALLYRSIRSGGDLIENGEKKVEVITEHILNLLSEEKKIKIDYLSVCDHLTLKPVETVNKKILIAVAACIEGVRLIDNLIVEA